MRMDNRADATSISRLFLGLIVGVVVFWIVSLVTEPLFAHTSEASGEVATKGTAWLQEGINFMPTMFLIISLFGIVAYAVFTREVLG